MCCKWGRLHLWRPEKAGCGKHTTVCEWFDSLYVSSPLLASAAAGMVYGGECYVLGTVMGAGEMSPVCMRLGRGVCPCKGSTPLHQWHPQDTAQQQQQPCPGVLFTGSRRLLSVCLSVRVVGQCVQGMTC
jgi:hypothetical protein